METWDINQPFVNFPSGLEINLRDEFLNLIYGHDGRPPRGHWIVYRKSDVTQHSQYWDVETQTAIGGPPFLYQDYLVRARYRSFSSGQEEYRDEIGLVERPIRTYYLDHRINPKKEDYIIEINPSSGLNAPNEFTVVGIYDILLVDSPRDQQGRVEYYVCMCKSGVDRGDQTLKTITITETL